MRALRVGSNATSRGMLLGMMLDPLNGLAAPPGGGGGGGGMPLTVPTNHMNEFCKHIYAT